MYPLTNVLQASPNEPSRRAFAGGIAKSLLGVGLLPDWFVGTVWAAGKPEPLPPYVATAKRVIYLYMAGGQSHLDTWDPRSRTRSPAR